MSVIQSTTWYGVPAWRLESGAISVVIVPAMGAKIVSLADRRSGLEWLAGPLPGRQVRPVAYGAPFEKQDMAGWDEMLPTILACRYPGPGPLAGVPLPDHGEVWALPWDVVEAGDDALALAVSGRALPYRLTRTAAFTAPDTLRLAYRLENRGPDPLPYLWAAHPQFLAGPDCQIILPPAITTVVNTVGAAWGWGPPEAPYDWPEATRPDGTAVRIDRVGPASARLARKFFTPAAARPAWTTLLRRDTGAWLRLAWDPAAVPYLGLWVDEGAISSEAIVAPEPGTGWYDDLALAWQKREVAVLAAGAAAEWALTARLGSDGRPETE